MVSVLACSGSVQPFSTASEAGASIDDEGVVAASAVAVPDERAQQAPELESSDQGGPDQPALTAAHEADNIELTPEREELFGFGTGIRFVDSCDDNTGTDPVLAALAVATAIELGRWQPTTDFRTWRGKLTLTATGEAQCADGQCSNTRALLDLQNDEASGVTILPGVQVNSSLLRRALSLAHFRQANCFSPLGAPFVGCRVPDHHFTLAHTAPGECDTNYWFTTTTPEGDALPPELMQRLERSLIWVNAETNDYIQFATDGNLVGIDPTYGLNEVGATESGSCSPACTRISTRDIAGSCCSCNGTRQYARSSWNANTYTCQ